MFSDLPPDLDSLITGPFRGPLRATLQQTLRTGLRVSASRVADAPLHSGLVGRLLGKRTALPVLPVLASKLGGRPYLEGDWPTVGNDRLDFVGQLNFHELSAGVESLPQRGILGVFMSADNGFAWRWHPWPDEARASMAPGPSYPRFECRLTAEPAPTVALGAAFDAEWELARERLPVAEALAAEAVAESLWQWTAEHAANVFSWLPSPLGGPGPREWEREPSRRVTETAWLQLWTPQDHQAGDMDYGSMTVSMMIAVEDLEQHEFGAIDALTWQ